MATQLHLLSEEEIFDARTRMKKCLKCGHKWNSRRKYVARLADHTEYSRKGMTDQDILDRILSGTLEVDMKGRFVTSHRRETKQLTVWEHTRNGSTYRFVSICLGHKKKISIHRLVWMAFWKQLVPEGQDVDHIKGREIENPDGIENLRLLPVSVNRSAYRDDFVTEEPF